MQACSILVHEAHCLFSSCPSCWLSKHTDEDNQTINRAGPGQGWGTQSNSSLEFTTLSEGEMKMKNISKYNGDYCDSNTHLFDRFHYFSKLFDRALYDSNLAQIIPDSV